MNDGDIALDYVPNRRPAIPACGARTYDTTRRIEHVMSEADRNALIDAYFDAMDAEDLELVRSALADGFVYESFAGDLEGVAGLETYMEELRGLSNTTHDVTLRVHDEAASVAEGTVTGESEDGYTEAEFCNVFEFDADSERISRIGVYLNDA